MHLFSKLTGLKTLLIDDSEDIRDALGLAFRRHNCFITTASTGEQGLRVLEGERFDVVICDFQLPGISGIKFFRQVTRSHPHTVRMMITGFDNPETIARAGDSGVHEFVRKPFSLITFMDRLIPYVDKYLDEKPDYLKGRAIAG